MSARILQTLAISLCGAAFGLSGHGQSRDLPRLERTGEHYRLIVDGKPYFVLGAQVHNSSGFPDALRAAWPSIHAMHANTVMIPVYWEAIEPEQGTFDFSTVDAAIEQARAEGVRLVLSWFGTWKNGAMTYVPAWVKSNPATYPLMQDAAHQPVQALSPMSDANRDRDRTAFAAFMHHLEQVDGAKHTVILIQVENEAGTLGTDRDYSSQADAAFHRPVPSEVLSSLHKQAASGASWPQVFAERAPEVFTSYYTARYMESVAKAGKAVYPLPMYINVWPREQPGLLRPGYSSPSGGAVAWLLEMWKRLAPDIDVIAPDIYDENQGTYSELLKLYDRPDNPLFVPETGGSVFHAKNMFLTLSSNNDLGISIFGVDSANADDLKNYKGWGSEIAMNFALFGSAASVWQELRDAGHVQAAIEDEGWANPTLTFDSYDVAVRFGPVTNGYGGQRGRGNPQRNGRILVGQLAPDQFLLAGMNANVIFAPRLGAAQTRAMLVRVEEGHFVDGLWHTDRLLNGDETAFGVTLPPHGKTLKVTVGNY
jgi:beta-galactosidase GanA